MNHAGEISYLTRLGRPTVALVNNATTAHIGGLGTVEDIANAKGEIFEGLAEDGVAIINADDEFAPLWKGLAAGRQVMTFGLDNPADVTATYQLHADGSDVQMQSSQDNVNVDGNVDFRLPVAGLHNVRNALAAAAAALAMGIDKLDIAKGLAGFGGVNGRLQKKSGLNGALVIDDTYNANPASMKAAIDVLAAQPGNRIMVMGDMGELGDDASAMHAEIGMYAKQSGISNFYALGELSHQAAASYGEGAQQFDTPEAVFEALNGQLDHDTVVLVKGSRFMRMERVVNLITTHDNEGSH